MVTIPQAEQQSVGFSPISVQNGVQPRTHQLGNVYGGFNNAMNNLSKIAGNALQVLQDEQDKTKLMEFENAYNRALNLNYNKKTLNNKGESAIGYLLNNHGYSKDMNDLQSAFFTGDEKLKNEYKIDFEGVVPERLREKALQIMNKANTGYYSKFANYAGQEESKARQIAYTNIQNDNVKIISNSNNVAETQAAIDSVVSNDFENIGVYDKKASEVIMRERLDKAFLTRLENELTTDPIKAANSFINKKTDYSFGGLRMSLNDFLTDKSKSDFIEKSKPFIEARIANDIANKKISGEEFESGIYINNNIDAFLDKIYFGNELDQAKSRIRKKAEDLEIAQRNEMLEESRKANNDFFLPISEVIDDNKFNTMDNLGKIDLSQYDLDTREGYSSNIKMFRQTTSQAIAEDYERQNVEREFNKLKEQTLGLKNVGKLREGYNKKITKSEYGNLSELEQRLNRFKEQDLQANNFVAKMDYYYNNANFNIETIISSPDFNKLTANGKLQALNKAKDIVKFNQKIRPLLEKQGINIDKEIKTAMTLTLGDKQFSKFASNEISSEVYKILLSDENKLNENTMPMNMQSYLDGVIITAKQNALNSFDKDTVDKLENVYNKAIRMVASKKAVSYEDALHKLIIDENWFERLWWNRDSLAYSKDSRYYNALASRDFTQAAIIREEK